MTDWIKRGGGTKEPNKWLLSLLVHKWPKGGNSNDRTQRGRGQQPSPVMANTESDLRKQQCWSLRGHNEPWTQTQLKAKFHPTSSQMRLFLCWDLLVEKVIRLAAQMFTVSTPSHSVCGVVFDNSNWFLNLHRASLVSCILLQALSFFAPLSLCVVKKAPKDSWDKTFHASFPQFVVRAFAIIVLILASSTFHLVFHTKRCTVGNWTFLEDVSPLIHEASSALQFSLLKLNSTWVGLYDRTL